MTCVSQTDVNDELIQRLLAEATHAATSAYAPYSRLQVGAALVTATDDVVVGCNVENSSYGLTMCAERNAIFTAVARHGPHVHLRALAVVVADRQAIMPCGACRQVMHEFNPDMLVAFRSAAGLERVSARDLLPYGFQLDRNA
jgi:cytidine deaminase